MRSSFQNGLIKSHWPGETFEELKSWVQQVLQLEADPRVEVEPVSSPNLQGPTIDPQPLTDVYLWLALVFLGSLIIYTLADVCTHRKVD
jgi:hypothetical protein